MITMARRTPSTWTWPASTPSPRRPTGWCGAYSSSAGLPVTIESRRSPIWLPASPWAWPSYHKVLLMPRWQDCPRSTACTPPSLAPSSMFSLGRYHRCPLDPPVWWPFSPCNSAPTSRCRWSSCWPSSPVWWNWPWVCSSWDSSWASYQLRLPRLLHPALRWSWSLPRSRISWVFA